MKGKISIIVPTYNVEKYISKCLDSLLKQDYPLFDIIVVNDGSPYNEQVIIDEYVSKYPNKIISIIKENGGYGSALEVGFEKSDAEYVLVCDPDDYLEPNALSTLYQNIEKTGADIAFGAKNIICTEDNSLTYHSSYNENYGHIDDGKLYTKGQDGYEMFYFIDPSPHSKLYLRDVVKNIKFPHKCSFSDNLLFFYSLNKANKFVYTSEALSYYLIDRVGNTSTDVKPKVIDDHLVVFNEILNQVSNEKPIFYYRIYEAFLSIYYKIDNINADENVKKEKYANVYKLLERLIPFKDDIMHYEDIYKLNSKTIYQQKTYLLTESTSKKEYDLLVKNRLKPSFINRLKLKLSNIFINPKLNNDKVKKIIYYTVMLMVILHPIIELDYLIYPKLNKLGLPRITTVINLIVLPLLVILVFCLFEKDKKKLLKFVIPYGILFGIYFILHVQNANYLQNNLYLTRNFVFLISDEIVYTISLLLPLVYIWVFNKVNIKEHSVKIITTVTSILISLPIFLSNLFVYGKSTYEGNTIDNIFSWFRLPYNEGPNHPRFYASKFLFEEGNTIGIILFIVLPFMYYFFYKEKDKKRKVAYGALIFIQSIAMMVLSTRVATMGAFLIPFTMLVIFVVLSILKIERFSKVFLIFTLLMGILTTSIFPFSPAYQNQKINAVSYEFQKLNDPEKEEVSKVFREGEEGLIIYSEEWFGYYTYMFEAYSYMIRVTPPAYYKDWYNYKHDPEFWCNLIFDYDLEERINGRQIQEIFLHYKYDYLTPYQKAFGMGYGTFMRGSMILERDFVQQYYSFGPIGFIFSMLPWLIMTIYLGIKLLFGYKKGRWTFYNIILMMSTCLGLVASYVSGHTIDELSSSLFIALCIAALYNSMKQEKIN